MTYTSTNRARASLKVFPTWMLECYKNEGEFRVYILCTIFWAAWFIPLFCRLVQTETMKHVAYISIQSNLLTFVYWQDAHVTYNYWSKFYRMLKAALIYRDELYRCVFRNINALEWQFRQSAFLHLIQPPTGHQRRALEVKAYFRSELEQIHLSKFTFYFGPQIIYI